MNNKVAIILGSENDKKYVEGSFKYFDFFNIKPEVHVISAHRNPSEVGVFASEAHKNGYSILIGSAGMAAHLAGVTASLTILPVLGVPTESKLKGLDSLLSTVQMPSGIPVGTLAIGKAGAINSALLAASILSVRYKKIQNKLKKYRSSFEKKVPKRPF